MTYSRESRPTPAKVERLNVSDGNLDTFTVPPTTDPRTDLDALAEHLRGVYVAQVVVDNAGHRRTYYYKNLTAVERAVRRARDRGRDCHVTLVQLVPIAVIPGAIR